MSDEKRAPTKKFKKAKKSRAGLWTFLALATLAGLYLFMLDLSRPHVTGDNLRFDTFLAEVSAGKVKDARFLDADSFIVGTHIRADGTPAEYNTPLITGSQSMLARELAEAGIPTTVDQQTKKRVASLAIIILPGFAIIILLVYLIISMRRGTGLFAVRSGARKSEKDDRTFTFADVAGQKAAVGELREVKEFLADSSLFATLGAQVPKGVLLFGPPGCGKTLMAKALAGEAGASFYSISGSDFIEMYVGVGAARVRELFKEARENAPALIFIDELDSIGRARGMVDNQQSHGEQEQALNQLLAEMDGFSTSDGIIVLAATNRADTLDPALLRPGRFDRKIALALPDEEARLEILSLHAQGKGLAPDVDLPAIARGAIGLTGADLAAVLNEGALLAGRARREVILQADLEQALHRLLKDPELQRRLSLRERGIGRRFAPDERVTFADVAGQEAAVGELSEIRDFLTDPSRFSDVGAVVPKGVLLFGPPGCGKTLLARALAGEANAAFFSVAASEFVEVFVGKGAQRVREVFAEARSMAPSIVFIDELDAVGHARGTNAAGQTTGEQEQTLTQILAEMDGFSPSDGIIVLAASNRPDVLDPALLRPGRFDRSIGLSLPDEEGRLAILRVHAGTKTLDDDVDLAQLANRAIGLSGADLANVMNEGALLAVRAQRRSVTQADLEQALQRIIEAPGLQRRLSLRERSIGKRFSADDRITFDDVAGVDDAIEELAEVKDYLADPARFAKIGARVPRGILLSGPPGCGKTLLARAVAGEANAAFFSVAGSDFVEVFVGEGASRVRELFAEARSMAPSIVFIDEIDAVGAARSARNDGSREAEQTLNQFLVELDGFEPNNAVIVMAATNRPDILDPALVRPGRFDRLIAITPPDRAGRKAILQLHGRDKEFDDDVDFDVVAGITRGFSGADLANVLNEAALLAARRNLSRITMAVVDEGVDRAMMGVASRGVLLSDEERAMVAYHEAGHALVAEALPGASPPHKLTIVARGPSLGHCSVADTHDRVIRSRSSLIDQMATMLAGREAEQLVYGEPGTGAASDLQKANEIARMMVCELGMSESLGSLAFSADASRYSDEETRAIAAAVRSLLDDAAERARSVLIKGRPGLDRVAAALLERETLTAAEIVSLAGSTRRAAAGKPVATPRQRRRPA